MVSEAHGGASDEGFEQFLKVALEEAPPAVADQLKAGLRKRYDRPPVDGMELCLNRNVPVKKAQQLLFSPSEEDMRLYPALVAMPPPGAPDDHPQRAVQVSSLASLYLVHSKRWERVRPFIEAGGLRQLAAALTHPNPYLAGQAMSSLLHMTDEEELFPWHDPPPTPDGRGPRQGPYARVWRAMFELSHDGVFLPNLLSHYRHPPAFPGASCMALRLFAFYVSWTRKHFTQDGRLSLSSSLLALLQQWAADEQVTGEERQLAAQLHKDFSRFPPAKEPAPLSSPGSVQGEGEGGDPQPGPRHHLGGLTADEDEPATTVASERTQINSGPSADNEGEQLKEQGNEAYRCGDFTAAVHLYSAALDVLVPAEHLLTEAPRRASYHANRAAAYMARAAAGRLREGDADTAGHLEGVDHGSEAALARHYEAAVMDCDMALDLQPAGRAAAKALLRKARALAQLGRREDAAAAARSGLARCDGGEGALRGELQEMLRAATATAAAAAPPPPPPQAKAGGDAAAAAGTTAVMGRESGPGAEVAGAAARVQVVATAKVEAVVGKAGGGPADRGSSGGGSKVNWNAMD
ncbi:hypothetical protein PLESTB_001130700 [Pleodorina starrii]|uniref:Uncharacterized protein n=1 Tax=Pleodorina starrii TaxID=330485 RepID=A0A9W6BR11_9CHLO|nr:hypothetical protein PLESTM_001368100 [Pleodorina starrii]GLC56649.1 hypothetical protein PLESTB_001130700 [Pleodorina starrii]GLC69036.1 hypothetical protein PLESTF_000772600 [Pleodorina starrii]